MLPVAALKASDKTQSYSNCLKHNTHTHSLVKRCLKMMMDEHLSLTECLMANCSGRKRRGTGKVKEGLLKTSREKEFPPQALNSL